jgi:hypothetical protein
MKPSTFSLRVSDLLQREADGALAMIAGDLVGIEGSPGRPIRSPCDLCPSAPLWRQLIEAHWSKPKPCRIMLKQFDTLRLFQCREDGRGETYKVLPRHVLFASNLSAAAQNEVSVILRRQFRGRDMPRALCVANVFWLLSLPHVNILNSDPPHAVEDFIYVFIKIFVIRRASCSRACCTLPWSRQRRAMLYRGA